MMHRVPLLLAALSLVPSASARPVVSPAFYESFSGFTIPADPVLPAKEVHPSLWFREGDLPALRARAADPFLRTRLAEVEARAPLGGELPPAPKFSDKIETVHKYYGTMSMAARAHAFLAIYSTDPTAQAAHRTRAIELLRRAYDGPIFQLNSNDKGSAVDEIYRGSWLQNYAHAYDCIQPLLSPAVDQEIRARLTLEAECVYENLYNWTPGSPHNHLSKPAWGLGSMALAMSSHPHARAWLARALEATNKNTRFFFSADGIYREGSHYLMFSLTNFLPFLYHYRNVSGVNAFPEFQPVFEAMVAARDSHGWLPNIEDSYIRPTPTHLAAGAYRDSKSWLSHSAPLSEVLMWSYRTCDLTPFEKERSESGLNYTGASWDYPLELDELLTYDPAIKSTAPDAAPTQFMAGGQTYFRDSWTNRGAGQRYLLFHGVAAADNHNHDDQLSYITEAEGQMMCSDSGYSRGTYTGAERTDWYITSAAHNTLTFDGAPAADPAPNQTPPSLFKTNEVGLAGEEKEAFFGKKATWRRAIFWVAGDYYIIADRLNAPQSGKVASYIHGGRAGLAPEGEKYTWTYKADRYGGAAQLLTWVNAPGASLSIKKGELTYVKGDYAEFPYLTIAKETNAAAWLTLLKPAPASGSPGFTAAGHTSERASTLEISAPDHRCSVGTQAAPGATLQVGDIQTDGAFVLVRRDLSGRVLAYAVLEGTKLSVAGKTLWQAASRQNVAHANP